MSTGYLTGHTAPENAFVVADYPYGFRLRTKIRYWIETTKHGMRMCSQTMNPKVPGEKWNKPKCSTYAPLMVLAVDEQGHIHQDGIGGYADEAQLDAFLGKYPEAFQTERDRKTIEGMRAWCRAQKRVTWSVRTMKPGEDEPQSLEDQGKIMSAIARDELIKMRRQGGGEE